ncbi:MAG: tetratricopeptide repeat protein [Planctomycetaceae bacterium]
MTSTGRKSDSKPAPALATRVRLPPRRWFRNAGFLSCLVAVALIAFSATLPWKGSGPLSSTGSLNAEWYLYLIAIQFVSMGILLATCGVPHRWPGRLAFIASNVALFAVAMLVSQFLLKTALFHTAQVSVRVAIAVAWLLAIVGIPFVAMGIARRRRSRDSQPFTFGKVWFAAMIFLITAEPVALVAERVEMARDQLRFPKGLSASDQKELRIVAVGESTMAGFPYNERFGIAEVAAWRLREMYPDRSVVIENLAKDGLNLKKAMQALEDITVRPDLLILYSGHNEFFYDLDEFWNDVDFKWERFDGLLSRSPMFRLFDRRLLSGEVQRDLEGGYSRGLVDRNIATDKALVVRLERFRNQLEQLAAWCQSEKIPTVWFIPAGSESDFEPSRSFLDHTPTESERKEIEAAAEEGRRLEKAGEFRKAADVYQKMLARYPNFAEFEFRLAECLIAMKDYPGAAKFYASALEHDGQPIRMTTPYREQVREVAARFQIPIVDVAEVLRPRSAHGILDRSLFVDYVHPNLRSYFALGMSAVDTIRKSGLLEAEFGPPAQTSDARFADAVKSVGLTAADLAKAYLRVAEADKTQQKLRYESSRLQRESEQYREWSRGLSNGTIQPGEAGTESLH